MLEVHTWSHLHYDVGYFEYICMHGVGKIFDGLGDQSAGVSLS